MTAKDHGEWPFDQVPNAACIASEGVMQGKAVLSVTHYADDHSWAFMDAIPADPIDAMIVAMSAVLRLHPDLVEVATLAPGCSASRAGQAGPWSIRSDA